MIKALFLIGQDFLGFDIIKNRKTSTLYTYQGVRTGMACISSLHLYCNYLEMIKARFLIGQDFLAFDMIKN